jgi:hypothetical protein
MDLRVPHAAPGIIEHDLQDARAEIESTQPAALAIARALGVVAVIAEINVPVIRSGDTDGEDDFLDAGQWSLEGMALPVGYVVLTARDRSKKRCDAGNRTSKNLA